MPETPPRPQWKVRLDGYHRFVVKRYMEVLETDRSSVLERMITQWVTDHTDQVAQAGADMNTYMSVRDELGEDGEDD